MKTKIIILSLIFFSVSAGAVFSAMSSNNYQIWSDVISTGGGEDQGSTNYQLQDTLGEPIVGRDTSANYGEKVGFRELDFFDGQQVLSLALSGTSLEFGKLSKTETKTGSHNITVDTNSYSGVSVTFSGNTLTCSACTGTNSISGIGSTAAGSSVGASQFGFNVIYSSGSSPSASSVAPYNTAGAYAFRSGDQIISSSGPINATVFGVNYIANRSGAESVGTYTATITFTATANF